MRTHLLPWVVAQAIALAAAAEPAGPFLTGEEAGSLKPGDLADITVLAAQYGAIWSLEVRETFFVKPPNLQANVYLAPDVASPTLRRGRVLWALQQESTDPSGYEWRVAGGPKFWAQVAAPGQEFEARPTRPRSLDRPFRVDGQLSDDELVSLVAFIRGSPEKPSKSTEEPDGSWSLEIGATVDGEEPILEIEKKAECFFVVTTERRHGAGQSIEVSRSGKGWQVVSVWQWVA